MTKCVQNFITLQGKFLKQTGTSNKSHLSLEVDEIVKVAKPVGYERVSGIYFLVDKSNVVYVGQSFDVAQRLTAHRFKREIKFSSSAWIEVPISSGDGGRRYLNMVESWYIHKFKPQYNTAIPIKDLDHLQRLILRSSAKFFRDGVDDLAGRDFEHCLSMNATMIQIKSFSNFP